MKRIALCAIAVLALAACNQGGEKKAAETTKADAAPPAAQGRWSIQGQEGGAGVRADGDATVLTLGQNGHALLVYDTQAVNAGDVAMAQFQISGTAGAEVNTVLMRHCNPEIGEEGSNQRLVLTEAPQTVGLRHAFKAAYACIRVSVTTDRPAEVRVSRPTLSVAAAQAAS